MTPAPHPRASHHTPWTNAIMLASRSRLLNSVFA